MKTLVLGLAMVGCHPEADGGSSPASGGDGGGSTSGGAGLSSTAWGVPQGGGDGKHADGVDTAGADGRAGEGQGGEGGASPPAPGAEQLYDPALFATFEITLPESCREALEVASDQYCECSLAYHPPAGESLRLPRVGIRLKGRASRQTLSEKPSFKIKLDEYVDGQRLFGTRRLTLNNMAQDPSMAHEVLGYGYLRATGVPAPLCNYARVLVDGDLYGLYANVETADDEFAERRFDPAPGNLFDTSNDDYFVDLTPEWLPSFELETNADPDASDLEVLIATIDASGVSFYTEVGAYLDWNEVLTLGAAQAIIADWDGYFGASNNYKLYHELERDRFLLIPWGIDQTFGTTDDMRDDPQALLDYAIDHSMSNRDQGVLFERCWRDYECRREYLAHVETALDVWNTRPLIDELEAALALTAEARAEDPRSPHDVERSAAFVDGLRTFLTERGAIVAAQLAEFR